MNKDGFILYTSFYAPVRELDDSQLGCLFRAIFADRMGTETESFLADSTVRMAFLFIKNQFDIDDRKYAEVYAQRKAAAAKSVEARKRRAALVNESQHTLTNVNLKEKEKEKVKEKEKEKVIRFTPPTRDELADYISSRSYDVDVEKFLSYYQSNGWKVGRNAMKDWRAAVRNWDAKERQTTRRPNYDQLHPIGDFTNERNTL